MNTIRIVPQPDNIVIGQNTFDEKDVIESTYQHRDEVRGAFMSLLYLGEKKIADHDHTKLEKSDVFTRALQTNFQPDAETSENWKEYHYQNERHHLDKVVPEDVDLLDVMEMLCDCVVAAKSRTGKISEPIEIPADVLLRAVENTVDLLDRWSIVVKK